VCRLVVTALIVVRMRWAKVRRGMHRFRGVSGRTGDGLLNRETTMHGTRVQLRRLRQTNGEPEGEHAGETSRDPVTTHGSNIRWERAHVRANALAKGPDRARE
jgi:hypothetical protein